jgi:hypothetical protein
MWDDRVHIGDGALVAGHAGRPGLGRPHHRPRLGPHRRRLCLRQGQFLIMTSVADPEP